MDSVDSVISRGPLSVDRQSRRRWQVKNTLLAKRLKWGPCLGNCGDERPLGREVRSGTQGAGPWAGLTVLLLQFEVATILNLNLQRSMEMEGFI